MTIDDAIKHAEEVAKANESWHKEYIDTAFEQHALNCKKCAEDHRKLVKWLKELKYAKVLLKATYDLLHKCDDSYYVLNMLEQTTVYDGIECDGYCLMEDIETFMEEWDDN